MAFVPVVSALPTFSGLRAAAPLSRPPRSAARPAGRPSRVRMIATEPSAAPAAAGAAPAAGADSGAVALTPRAAELLSYVRGHKSLFRPGLGFNSTTATLCRKNDTGRLLTPADELDTNEHELPGVAAARAFLAAAPALTAAAVAAVAAAAPHVAESALLRDVVEFNLFTVLRVVSYGAAAQSDDFVHENNAGMMRMLHEELAVPHAAVAAALDGARDAVVAEIEDKDVADTTAACFDVMKKHLV